MIQFEQKFYLQLFQLINQLLHKAKLQKFQLDIYFLQIKFFQNIQLIIHFYHHFNLHKNQNFVAI